ncbi:unnamed protein product [Nesidiocoris tenuis]|uniref:60S ribosomal export protein NMD3 n=1 Tax=Nesidiocoris tenuis TaxID=355587 RepID=A0A6H5H4H4_9HEMI|nr:unnamed protein product [Nesidiocoris tenuis]
MILLQIQREEEERIRQAEEERIRKEREAAMLENLRKAALKKKKKKKNNENSNHFATGPHSHHHQMMMQQQLHQQQQMQQQQYNHHQSKANSNAFGFSNPMNNSNPASPIVTIKKIMENDSEPTVTITLRGATPKQDKVLYTLLNGKDLPDKVPASGASLKKRRKKKETEATSKQKMSTAYPGLDIEIVKTSEEQTSNLCQQMSFLTINPYTDNQVVNDVDQPAKTAKKRRKKKKKANKAEGGGEAEDWNTLVTVQGEVVGGAVLEQVFVVEYVVAHQMCDDCHRVEAQNFWRAVVQVRQKAVNKKTFYYLEQLILKHKAHDNTLGIKPIHGKCRMDQFAVTNHDANFADEGLDFFYATETHARKMIDFLNTVLPIRYQLSKRLLSHDVHSNIYNYKFTMSVEIVPISKDSLVCLSKKMAGQMGAIGQLCVVQRVTNSIHLIDPTTAQIAEVTGTHYWRDPFTAVCDPKQLVEYIVMDIDLIEGKDRNVFPGQGQLSHKHAMADVWVVRASDIGSDDAMLHTRTHIGHLLKVGDSALGYNVQDCNVNNSHFEKLNRDKMPDVVLVKKHYGDRAKKRAWKLKHLPRDDTSIGSANKDYAAFLNDLEEDPVYRQNVNIYRDPTKQIPVDADDVDDPFAPRVTLDEMLDEMHIVDDEEMAEGQ